MRSLAVGLSLLFIPLSIGGLAGVVGANDHPAARLVVSSGLAILSVYLLAESFLVQVRVGADFVEHSSPWRRRRRVAWGDIRDWSRDDVNGYLILQTPQGKIRISDFMVGARALAERLNRDRYQRMMAVPEEVNKAHGLD
ncbi:MAG TPA: hypothetical protein VHO25_11195 [Polyangiaceae bacterium]|nr:hypothetical protein [Polyangiaceae bacterium]